MQQFQFHNLNFGSTKRIKFTSFGKYFDKGALIKNIRTLGRGRGLAALRTKVDMGRERA